MAEEPVTPLPEGQAAATEKHALTHGYLERDAVAVDTLADELAGGPMGETISTRWARWATEPQFGRVKRLIGRVGCRLLNLVSPDHGAKAELGDLARAKDEAARIEKTPTVKEEGQ